MTGQRVVAGGTVVLLILAATFLAGVRFGGAQAGNREGAFVAAQDGSRWVVGNGQRHRID
jgi:hypothetical protein